MYQQAALTLSRWNSTQTHACLNFTIVFLFIRTHSSQSCRSCLHVLILLNIPKLIAMQPSWLDTWRYRFLKLAEYQIQGIAISTALKNGNTNLSDTLPCRQLPRIISHHPKTKGPTNFVHALMSSRTILGYALIWKIRIQAWQYCISSDKTNSP